MAIKGYLITAGLLASLALGGCKTAETAQGEKRYVPQPEAILGSNENVGQDLVDLLKDEFDYVGYYEICAKRNESNMCIDTDLVIRGEEQDATDSYHTVWGINLDCCCQAYTLGRPIIDYILGRDVISEQCDGSVVPKNMNKNTAKKLAAFLDIRTKLNGERCKEWVEMIKTYYGPFGPAGRHKK